MKLVKCAYDALKAAADMIKPGTMYRDLGCSIAQVLRLYATIFFLLHRPGTNAVVAYW